MDPSIQKIVTILRTYCIPMIGLVFLLMDFNTAAYAWGPEVPLHCQVMGMHMALEEDDVNVDGDDYKISIFGAAAQRPYHKNDLEYGIEGGLLFSMENDTRLVEVSSGESGGEIRIQFENRMLLIDYFGGGYVAYSFGKRLRLFAAAGPMIVFGTRESDPKETDDDSVESQTQSRLSAGLYARTGIEFRILENFLLGAGIRAVTSGLEFDEPPGKIRYDGIQYIFNVSYTITSF